MVDGHSMGPGLQLVGARFLNFHPGCYHESSNFVQYRYLTKFKWPYFSHVVQHAGSLTRTVYVDMTLT